MKKIFKLVFVFTLLILSVKEFTNKVYAFSGHGNGTSNDPYLISTPQQLDEIRNNLLAHYKLQNDINLNNEIFEYIGVSSAAPFSGKLDGNGYKIINLNSTKGLFGVIKDATLVNIT